ncbi:hypothetical protein EDD22DRAFT_845813 [Suillus occidentalis]|nr:hypothetical protein EDD22DRAFT_845813 [Suillus occidentalis]
MTAHIISDWLSQSNGLMYTMNHFTSALAGDWNGVLTHDGDEYGAEHISGGTCGDPCGLLQPRCPKGAAFRTALRPPQKPIGCRSKITGRKYANVDELVDFAPRMITLRKWSSDKRAYTQPLQIIDCLRKDLRARSTSIMHDVARSADGVRANILQMLLMKAEFGIGIRESMLQGWYSYRREGAIPAASVAEKDAKP